jgi:CheY-like chemotaxis protein
VPAIDANEGRLGQVFLNLIVNAAQAIPEGNSGKNEIRITTKLDGNNRVVIEIRDTGSGMPEAVISKMFDPFFTTKAAGVGTGLGLAICHRLVVAMHGVISAESQVGKGTVFRVCFPVAVPAVPAPAPPPTTIPSGRRGRVLIVDDEPMLANLVRRMLAPEHDLTVVTDARKAIELASAGERFDVIISDLMMPDVTGMDLHAALLALSPGQAERMIFMTGGAFTPGARDFLNQVRNPRIEKPFDVNTLKALVHSMTR